MTYLNLTSQPTSNVPNPPDWFWESLIPSVIASVSLIVVGWMSLLLLYKMGLVDPRSKLILKSLIIEIPTKVRGITRTRSENTKVEQESAELKLPNPEGDLYLVTGDYSGGGYENLEHVKHIINTRGNDAAFSLHDRETEISPDVKFYLIAARVDYIILVSMGVGSGLSQEMTIIRSNISYYRKTYILCQESDYSNFSITHRELIDSLSEENRLFEWTDKDDLERILRRIP